LNGENLVRFLSAPGAKIGRFCPIGAQPARKLTSDLTATRASNCKKRLEARVGIEPTHKGFADLSLTTWVPRLVSLERTNRCVIVTARCRGIN
jgi:hypothetical protein